MKRAATRLSHDQVALLMPGFIRGRLDTVRQRQVQEHVAGCPACALRHRRELELAEAIEQTPQKLEILLTTASRDRNRSRLMQRIDTGHNAGDRKPANRQHLAWPLRSYAAAAGITTLMLGSLVAAHYITRPAEQGPVGYRTQTAASLSVETAKGRATYRVVFGPDVSLESIQTLLLHMDAEVVGGPTRAGVYTLAFPITGSTEDEVLGRLRQQPGIVFAERSTHRDG